MENGKIQEEFEEDDSVACNGNCSNDLLKNSGIDTLHRLMALALLKPEKEQMNEGFKFVKTSCKEDLKTIFEPLFQYFDSHWMNKIGPEGFSVFGLTDRTDNATESYHRDWRSRVQTKPYLSTFLGNGVIIY